MTEIITKILFIQVFSPHILSVCCNGINSHYESCLLSFSFFPFSKVETKTSQKLFQHWFTAEPADPLAQSEGILFSLNLTRSTSLLNKHHKGDIKTASLFGG